MTDLQARAKAYAVSVLNNSDSETFTRQEMYYAIAEAYEQGYVDCDTKGEQPETQEEYFNDAPDCRYFRDGNCSKGLPGTPCERKGCMAYYPKDDDNEELIAYLTRKNVETYEDAHQLWRNELTKALYNLLLDASLPFVKGESLKDIDYSVNIPKENITCFPIVGETEPYVYEPNKEPDWSVHIDLARCSPAQLRYLSELGYDISGELLRRERAKTSNNDTRTI